MLCVCVCFHSFPSDRRWIPSSVAAATASERVRSVWTDYVDVWDATEAVECRRWDPLAGTGRDTSAREESTAGLLGLRARHHSAYSGGGLRLCSFLSSSPFQYLKLLSKCCIRLGRSAKAEETRTNYKPNIKTTSRLNIKKLIENKSDGLIPSLKICFISPLIRHNIRYERDKYSS